MSSTSKMPPLSNMQELLWPFSAAYASVLSLRNLAFDKGWLNSESFAVPVIAVGNLSTGGTGKTPMTEFLLRHLPGPCAVVSRGYGRQTKGLLEVNPKGTAREYGDEPLQMARKFNQVPFVVAEKRVEGIKHLLDRENAPRCIILDDAFQHRYVKATCNILLSTWQNPFFSDQVIPAGRLRESRAGAKRAQAIVFTKCPSKLDAASRDKTIEQVRPYSTAPVFFAGIDYQQPVNELGQSPKQEEVAVLTGIANPLPMLNYLRNKYDVKRHFSYDDHHTFRSSEIREVAKYLAENRLPLLTTEKDFARLQPWLNQFEQHGAYYLPMQMTFQGGDEQNFMELLGEYIKAPQA